MRRAMPLGLAAGLSACDLYGLLTEPEPRVEQTWNIPADSMSVSVASLLPPSVSIYSTPGSTPPDSSAFSVSMTLTGLTRRLGDDCAPCETLDGQNAIKPAFVLTATSTSNLPTDVVGGTLAGGTINVQITNNLSFDPLRVLDGPGAQGYMVIALSSGGVPIGRDSVNGATTPFTPGSVLARPIALLPGQITGAVSVTVTVNSPMGDRNEFINANSTLSATATVPSFRVSQVRMNVSNRTMSSPGTDTLDLEDMDEDFTSGIVSSTLEMTISNPFAVTGNVDMRFAYGPSPAEVITKSLAFPTGAGQVRTLTLTGDEVRLLFGNRVAISMSGGVSSAAPIDVTPKQAVTIANRLIARIRTGGSN